MVELESLTMKPWKCVFLCAILQSCGAQSPLLGKVKLRLWSLGGLVGYAGFHGSSGFLGWTTRESFADIAIAVVYLWLPLGKRFLHFVLNIYSRRLLSGVVSFDRVFEGFRNARPRLMSKRQRWNQQAGCILYDPNQTARQTLAMRHFSTERHLQVRVKPRNLLSHAIMSMRALI